MAQTKDVFWPLPLFAGGGIALWSQVHNPNTHIPLTTHEGYAHIANAVARGLDTITNNFQHDPKATLLWLLVPTVLGLVGGLAIDSRRNRRG